MAEKLAHFEHLLANHTFDEFEVCKFCRWLMLREDGVQCSRCAGWLCRMTDHCDEELYKCDQCQADICYDCCFATEQADGVTCDECQ